MTALPNMNDIYHLTGFDLVSFILQQDDDQVSDDCHEVCLDFMSMFLSYHLKMNQILLCFHQH